MIKYFNVLPLRHPNGCPMYSFMLGIGTGSYIRPVFWCDTYRTDTALNLTKIKNLRQPVDLKTKLAQTIKDECGHASLSALFEHMSQRACNLLEKERIARVKNNRAYISSHTHATNISLITRPTPPTEIINQLVRHRDHRDLVPQADGLYLPGAESSDSEPHMPNLEPATFVLSKIERDAFRLLNTHGQCSLPQFLTRRHISEDYARVISRRKYPAKAVHSTRNAVRQFITDIDRYPHAAITYARTATLYGLYRTVEPLPSPLPDLTADAYQSLTFVERHELIADLLTYLSYAALVEYPSHETPILEAFPGYTYNTDRNEIVTYRLFDTRADAVAFRNRYRYPDGNVPKHLTPLAQTPTAPANNDTDEALLFQKRANNFQLSVDEYKVCLLEGDFPEDEHLFPEFMKTRVTTNK